VTDKVPLWTELVPVGAALVSTAGALYVGRRQRSLNRTLARRERELADSLIQRQLLISVGTRALLVSKYTNDVAQLADRQFNSGVGVQPSEMARRTDRLDIAYESMLERWAEIVSSNLEVECLPEVVDDLIDQMERVRLLMALDKTDVRRLIGALRETSLSAAACHELCARLAKGTSVERQRGRR